MRDREPGFESRNLTDEQVKVRDKPCIDCGSAAGQACTGSRGPRKQHHWVRAKAAGYTRPPGAVRTSW